MAPVTDTVRPIGKPIADAFPTRPPPRWSGWRGTGRGPQGGMPGRGMMGELKAALGLTPTIGRPPSGGYPPLPRY